MKKFEKLGKILSRDEQKKIKGGSPPDDEGLCRNGSCSDGVDNCSHLGHGCACRNVVGSPIQVCATGR